MGWKKKVHSDLTTIAVSVETAVDWSKCPKADFTRTRLFESLVFKEGEQPITFTLRPLPPAILARIETLQRPENLQQAFLFGVRSCSAAGELGLRWEGDSDASRHVSVDALSGIPAKVWKELGQLVLDRENLTEGEEPNFAALRGW
jgi:hypothetical protein